MTEAPIGLVRSNEDLRTIFRERIVALDLTYEQVDALAGLPRGYTSKVMAGMKRFGPIALEAFMGVTGVMLVAVEDAEALARIGPRFEARRRAVANRASSGYYIVKRTRKYMAEIGRLGGVKSGASRHAMASRKRAFIESQRARAIRRWERKNARSHSPACNPAP